MTGLLVLDNRCRPLRRELGPAAWMILEEAALSSVESSDGRLWSPISVRSAVVSVGLGRESATRSIGALVRAGLLRRAEVRRGEGGRFGPVGYWLLAPPGLVVTGVDRIGASADPGVGPPCPVVPATGDGRDLDSNAAGGGCSGCDKADAAPAVQASLFAAVEAQEAEPVAAEGTPRAVMEPVGAVSSRCCEVEGGVHELAPEVPAKPGPGVRQVSVGGGDERC